MKKFWIIVIIILLLLASGVITAIYVYNVNKAKDSNIGQNNQLAQDVNDNNINDKIVATSKIEEKISPNAIIIEKQYYKGCDHLIRKAKEIPEQLVNKTQMEFKQYYSDWNIESFSNNEIIVYQEKEGYCNRHYIIKENNGVLAIYTIDEKGKQIFKENTEIQTMYLTEDDLEKIKQGIEAIGDTELYTILEDFE